LSLRRFDSIGKTSGQTSILAPLLHKRCRNYKACSAAFDIREEHCKTRFRDAWPVRAPCGSTVLIPSEIPPLRI
jgi:hypothetical protein